MNTDQAREIQDAAAIDAFSVPAEQLFIHTAESWYSDCADLITRDKESDERLRQLCALALGWRDLIGRQTMSDAYGQYAAVCAEIGSLIVANLVANGIDKVSIGE